MRISLHWTHHTQCHLSQALITHTTRPYIRTRLAGSDTETDNYIDLGSDNSVDPTWRRHMVFGGTSILQHTEKNEGEGQSEGWDEDKPSIYLFYFYLSKHLFCVPVSVGMPLLLSYYFVLWHHSYDCWFYAGVTLSVIHSIKCSNSIIQTLSPLPSFFFFSDDVEVSEDTVPTGNFAMKARAALSALSSPPDKVRYFVVKSDS